MKGHHNVASKNCAQYLKDKLHLFGDPTQTNASPPSVIFLHSQVLLHFCNEECHPAQWAKMHLQFHVLQGTLHYVFGHVQAMNVVCNILDHRMVRMKKCWAGNLVGILARHT